MQSFNIIGNISGFAVIAAAVLIGFAILVFKFYRGMSGWFRSSLSKYVPLDPKMEKRVSRLSAAFSILTPLYIICSMFWVILVQNKGILFGRELWEIGRISCFAIQILFLLSAIRLISCFHTCYKQNKDNAKRPIFAIIVLCYAGVIIWGIVSFVALLTKERPFYVLSALAATAALFIFALQNLINSLVVRVQVNMDRLVRIGDWISIESKGIDGVVEMVSSQMVKVRGWDGTLESFPIRMLLEEPIVNYQEIFSAGARRIKRALFIDQRSVRFLSAEETEALKKQKLITDEMLKHADFFPETENISGSHLWTNIELFNLYAEDYLRRRSDIRHDMRCIVRSLAPCSKGIPLEVYCYSTQTLFVNFEPVQRAVFYHLLAVLPSFSLRVFQDCSDICQTVDETSKYVGDVFRYDKLKNPFRDSGK